ncbi:MAG: hypothetical protein H3C41_10600 [Bacteroidales bacterium]|nr:hypothetical protein [Bacteroidales bacterium]
MLRNPLRSFRSIGPAASTARCARPLRGLRTSSGFTQCLRFRSLRLQAPALRKAAGPLCATLKDDRADKIG